MILAIFAQFSQLNRRTGPKARTEPEPHPRPELSILTRNRPKCWGGTAGTSPRFACNRPSARAALRRGPSKLPVKSYAKGEDRNKPEKRSSEDGANIQSSRHTCHPRFRQDHSPGVGKDRQDAGNQQNHHAGQNALNIDHLHSLADLRLHRSGVPATIEIVDHHSDRVERIWADIERIRAEAPVVHNITNYVVMNTTANALLALGASPVMAHAEEEAAEMTAIARSLVINIGTLSTPWIAAMFTAGHAAMRMGHPIVLDPVGAGATAFRTDTARKLLAELSPAIVRGNASEIRALAYDEQSTRGVDSAHAADDAAKAAHALSARHGSVVVASGAVDLISSAGALTRVCNGHPMMPKVTGMGCTASALAGAFAAVNPSARDAAVNAMAVMGIAGELAAGQSPGPGTFPARFLDALYLLNEAAIRQRLQVRES